MTSRNGEVAKLVRRLEREGWDVRQSRRNSHFHVRDPETGRIVAVFASSPGDRRTLANTEADIKRARRQRQARNRRDDAA